MNDDHEATLTGPGRFDPTQIGTCRIEARLATGLNSRVYRGVDVDLARTVVVKLLLPNPDDPKALRRALDAAEKMVGLQHPHVVSVLKRGESPPHMVLDYVDGEDLERAVRREHALVPAAAVRVILDAAAGLDAALGRGVLHGDIRPRHLIRARGETRVIGFSASPQFKTAQGRRFTGHPGYVAPELANGGGGDFRADMYALGITLFELVAGRGPWGNIGPDALVACHVHEPLPSFSAVGVDVPPELDDFVQRLVAKQPEKRFASYRALMEAGTTLLPTLRRLVAAEPVLIVEEGRQIGLRTPVPEGDLLLGRVLGEGIAIDDGRVSRRHALIRRKGDFLQIEDLQSRNGIKVNGVEVRSRQLLTGDRIEIGDTLLRVEIPRGVGAPHVMPPVPASPVRGAFGDVEVVHPPALQATAENLAQTDGPGAQLRLQLLARLAPLLARTNRDIAREVLRAAREVLGADDHLLVRVRSGKPLFDAGTSHEAQLLSCALPAIERALPGQLALATAVRVGADDRWSVLLAPILVRGDVTMLFVLVRRNGSFDAASLGVLEGAAALLSVREQEDAG